MNKSKRAAWSLLLAAAFAAAIPAHAADKAQLEEARLLFAAMHFERQLNAMFSPYVTLRSPDNTATLPARFARLSYRSRDVL